MRAWGKLLAAGAALLLTGCLWTPGKFTSELALRKGGAFVLDYRGEIILQMPEDSDGAPLPWRDSLLHCFTDGRVQTGEAIISVPVPATGAAPRPRPAPVERPCTRAEIDKAKADHERTNAERDAKKRKDSEQMAKMFGLPGQDDESNRRFAASLMKYEGWRSATYRGKGVFDVDYHFEGRADQDFAFPLMPDSNLIVPFVAIRRRDDGSVLVTAPGLTGGSGPFGARALAMGLPDANKGPKSRAEGRFTIATDGDILTNNSEDGPTAQPTGRQVRWDVGPGSTKIPEMLVRL